MNKVLLFVSEETEKEIVQDAYEKNGDLYEKEAYVLERILSLKMRKRWKNSVRSWGFR